MKHELFVEQPNIELMKGIKVTKDTELTYNHEKVEQVLKNLILETILDSEGSNGINTYKSKSYISINLNDGDILLFDEERGYYLPPYPVSTIEDAISDITSLKDITLKGADDNDTNRNEEENS